MSWGQIRGGPWRPHSDEWAVLSESIQACFMSLLNTKVRVRVRVKVLLIHSVCIHEINLPKQKGVLFRFWPMMNVGCQ